MERKSNGLTFSDGLLVDLGGQRTAVDATIIEAPRGRTTKNGLGNSKDKAARYTIKHGEKHHVDKAHIATDTHGMVKDYVYDTAKVHDRQHIDQLTEDEISGGFRGHPGARLKDKGVHDGIIQRRVRGQAQLRPEQKAHNKRCQATRDRGEALRLVQTRTGVSHALPGHA